MNDIVLSKEILLENGFRNSNKFFDQVAVSEFGDDAKPIFELSVNSERQENFSWIIDWIVQFYWTVIGISISTIIAGNPLQLRYQYHGHFTA